MIFRKTLNQLSWALVVLAVSFSISAQDKVVVIPLFSDTSGCGSNKDPNVICTSGVDQFRLPLRMSVSCNPNITLTRADRYFEIYPDPSGYWQSLKSVPSKPTIAHLHVSLYWAPSSIPSTTGIVRLSVDKFEGGSSTPQNIYLFQNLNVTCSNAVNIAAGQKTAVDVWGQGEGWDVSVFWDFLRPVSSVGMLAISFNK